MKVTALVPLAIAGLVAAAVSGTISCGQTQFNQNNAAYGGISPDSKFVTLNGIRVHYLEWGRGKSYIILLHGMNGDARTWRDLAPFLASDYHILAPDRRGSGESEKPNEGYDYPTLVNDVALFSEHLKLESTIVIGHSFGAQVAMMLAAKKPESVRALVLIDGGFWPKRITPGSTAPSSEIEKMSRDYDPETVYPKIRVPVLMVVARGAGPGAEVIAQLKEKGIDFFEEVSKAEQGVKDLANQKLRRGQMVVIENTSHNVQADQPKKLAEAIKQFLSDLESTRK
ncbi:MAG TPA: alpha/beta hydrolase [Acidobacteriota bacterium]|nr:alpha/beta hydrolase [Acidobacteriota bacterium]